MDTISLNPPVKSVTLPVMEAFQTLQGEGFHQGKPAYFIRLAGCDVGCHWCDVKPSWDASLYPNQTVGQIVADARESLSKIVVITGGEPLMHDLTSLTATLKNKGKDTHIETSGAHPLTGQWDWICLSPKKFKSPLSEIYKQAHELKVVIFNRSDLAWAEEQAALVPRNCHLFLQPEWSKREIMMPLMVEYIKENPKWRISLQIHKYLNIP